MPALPRPAIARPTMKATELGAAPQMAEPISKSPMETRKTPLTLKKLYSFPKLSWNEQLVSR